MIGMRQTRTYKLVSVLLLALLACGACRAQDDSFRCGLQLRAPQRAYSSVTGGKHVPAQGTFRILLVFASFPDDTTFHPYWPAHQPPDSMRRFIDADTVIRSADPFSLTCYFHEMSLGQFHLIGDVIWLESARPRDEYSNGSFGRANTDIIKERLDTLVDFSQYDHWTRLGDYQTMNLPDGIVDMIVMVWRTTVFQLYGEASLGYKAAIVADGKRIEMGFPENVASPVGSGVTCEYPYGDSPQLLMKTMAHEIGHWLLGGLHPYSTVPSGKHQYWGMICAGQRISSCVNAYERERLGWITVPEVDFDRDITLRDYVRSGDALKFHPPTGEPEEYFYFENHQQSSVFDDVTRSATDRGVWILHQQNPYMELDDLRICASDGNWNWTNAGARSFCFGTSVPAFRRGEPEVHAGLSHRDQIPTESSVVNWMYALQRDTGAVMCGEFLGGEGLRGAFDTAGVAVFSMFSNPCSNTWNNDSSSFAFEVLRVNNGVVTVRAYNTPLEASPARRYLGIDPVYKVGRVGQLPLAWGSQWSNGQALEPDVSSSMLQRRIDNGAWVTVYEGPAAEWVDWTYHYDSTGSQAVAFRVRVQDTQGKLSTWSNQLLVRSTGATGIAADPAKDRNAALLEEPFPNPSNPISDIRYQISDIRHVRLSVCDLLGREVAVLVNERKEPGRYAARFDGTGLASGVYICRLVVGGWHDAKKIVVVK
jgi:M6 family metalloprotease-like protein